MPSTPKNQKRMKSAQALRASVSFPPELYHAIEAIAKQKKVSVAWVVRDAAERYVADSDKQIKEISG
jgi:metal-responsive CopG/Arc/MetJ family transcriptional regulator